MLTATAVSLPRRPGAAGREFAQAAGCGSSSRARRPAPPVRRPVRRAQALVADRDPALRQYAGVRRVPPGHRLRARRARPGTRARGSGGCRAVPIRSNVAPPAAGASSPSAPSDPAAPSTAPRAICRTRCRRARQQVAARFGLDGIGQQLARRRGALRSEPSGHNAAAIAAPAPGAARQRRRPCIGVAAARLRQFVLGSLKRKSRHTAGCGRRRRLRPRRCRASPALVVWPSPPARTVSLERLAQAARRSSVSALARRCSAARLSPANASGGRRAPGRPPARGASVPRLRQLATIKRGPRLLQQSASVSSRPSSASVRFGSVPVLAGIAAVRHCRHRRATRPCARASGLGEQFVDAPESPATRSPSRTRAPAHRRVPADRQLARERDHAMGRGNRAAAASAPPGPAPAGRPWPCPGAASLRSGSSASAAAYSSRAPRPSAPSQLTLLQGAGGIGLHLLCARSGHSQFDSVAEAAATEAHRDQGHESDAPAAPADAPCGVVRPAATAFVVDLARPIATRSSAATAARPGHARQTGRHRRRRRRQCRRHWIFPVHVASLMSHAKHSCMSVRGWGRRCEAFSVAAHAPPRAATPVCPATSTAGRNRPRASAGAGARGRHCARHRC